MSLQERADTFKAAVARELGAGNYVSGPMLGLSNCARMKEASLFVGGPNLTGFVASNPAEVTSFAVTSAVIPLPGIEIHFAVAFKQATPQVRASLDRLSKARQDAGESLGINNTLMGLSPNGNLLLGLGKETEMTDAGFKPDMIFLAVHPNGARARLSPAIQEVVDLFRSMLGPERIQRLELWAGENIPPSMRRMPASIPADVLRQDIANLGGVFPPDLINRLHIALNYHAAKHFVILSGVSGTGKTSIVQRYAYAVHGLRNLTDADPLFFWCRVRPDWTDPSGLLGHYDIFTKRYKVPPFLEAILTAEAFPASPVFVCLDEMNLARVEYYFADVLSAMETPESKLQLHTNAEAYEGDSGIRVPKAIKWPTNLFVIGTINVDETTTNPSPKVLDRASVIDMSEVNVEAVLAALGQRAGHSATVIGHCGPVIKQMHAVLSRHGLSFGFRAIDEVLRYVTFGAGANTDLATVSPLLDQQINQKILPKLRGTQDQAQLLRELVTALNGYPLSTALVQRMERELSEFGSFQAMR